MHTTGSSAELGKKKSAIEDLLCLARWDGRKTVSLFEIDQLSVMV